jgi:ligand-binding sensor domain-containing protein
MKRIIIISLLILGLISCEKDVFTGLLEGSIPEYGKVFVSSNPGGYKIFIDNKNMGVVSPDTVLYLTAGQHKLNLRHDLFSDTTLTITVDKSTVKIISIDMLKNPRFYATLTLYSIPSAAKIYLNDQLINNIVTPTTIRNVYPGKYELKLSKKDCRDDSTNIVVKGGEFVVIQRILEDTSRTVSYRTNNSDISSNSVNKIIIDKFNNKWIGTVDHGLIKFDGKNWTSYENAGVIEGKRIQDLLIDKSGKLWIASIQGLFVYDGISWRSLTSNLPSENVIALDEDPYGNIWIATLNALAKYNGNTFQIFNSENTDVTFLNLSSVTSSKNGDIWVGTSGSGLLKFNGITWTNYLAVGMDLEPPKVSNIIKDIIVDKNGNLFSFHAADPPSETRRALIRYDGTYWTELKLNLLFALDVESFYLDNSNNIWMALNGGLVKYNPPQPLKFYDADSYGYFNKWCTSFSLDLNGDGWLATKGAGIAKLKKGTF